MDDDVIYTGEGTHKGCAYVMDDDVIYTGEGTHKGCPLRMDKGCPRGGDNDMIYNPDIHHRRSIRLDGYDYSHAGAYFISIAAQGRLCLFGSVVDGSCA